MGKILETKFKYLGSFRANEKKYEVMEDVNNDVINIFYKSKEDVECYTVKKHHVERQNSKGLLKGTELHWKKIMGMSYAMMAFTGFKPNLQVFEIGFWEDVIIPFKNGEDDSFTIERVE